MKGHMAGHVVAHRVINGKMIKMTRGRARRFLMRQNRPLIFGKKELKKGGDRPVIPIILIIRQMDQTGKITEKNRTFPEVQKIIIDQKSNLDEIEYQARYSTLIGKCLIGKIWNLFLEIFCVFTGLLYKIFAPKMIFSGGFFGVFF